MIARHRSAMASTASSHDTGAKSPAPLGPTRRSGVSTRSGECTRSAYSRTLPQMTPRVNGWSGLPVTDVNRPHGVRPKVSWPRMRARLARLNPFKTPEAKRLAFLFGVVYFAQGMWYLPDQTVTIVLKDRGLTASQVADVMLIAWLPWFIKPLYGLLSDFVPLFGRRRQSYFLLT